MYMNPIVIVVQGCVKNYHWGKTGDDSYIAKFEAVSRNIRNGSRSASDLDENGSIKNKPLAELWFGSHPSGPANLIIHGNIIKLDDYIQRCPEMIGSIDIYNKCNKTLPFLFKILSIAQPLSLQAHPDKKLAHILYQKDPKNYPDSNHKPELAIALTDFEVLCDFRPISELSLYMEHIKPFRRVIGEDNCDRYLEAAKNCHIDKETHKKRLATCFKALMTCDKDIIMKETRNLIGNDDSAKRTGSKLVKLIEQLNELYPGDRGVFAPFFLNHITLATGQAVYLKANKLHAYIKGECIECMACSDNVVRAGLTSKFVDVDTLIKMLDYESVRDPKDLILKASTYGNNPCVTSFAFTDEFKVDKIVVSARTNPNGEFKLDAKSSGSFMVVMDGEALTRNFFDASVVQKLELGSAAFIPPNTPLKLYHIQGTLTIYRSYCK